MTFRFDARELRNPDDPDGSINPQTDGLWNAIVDLENEKGRNEQRWSNFSTPYLAVATVVLSGSAVAVAVGHKGAVPASLAGAAGLVGTASHLLPFDRKRIGNKILHAKAIDLRERLEDIEARCSSDGLKGPELRSELEQIRFEKNVLKATSSAEAALKPFRELLEEERGSR